MRSAAPAVQSPPHQGTSSSTPAHHCERSLGQPEGIAHAACQRVVDVVVLCLCTIRSTCAIGMLRVGVQQAAGITMAIPSQQRPLPDLSKIKAVLFDVDGTLTDSDPLHFKAFQEILVQYGYKVGPQYRHPMVPPHGASVPHDMQQAWVLRC